MPWMKCEICKREIHVDQRVYKHSPVCSSVACSATYAMLEAMKMSHWRHLDHSGATRSWRAWE